MIHDWQMALLRDDDDAWDGYEQAEREGRVADYLARMNWAALDGSMFS